MILLKLNDNNWIKSGPKLEGKPAMEHILSLYLACNPDPDRMCYSHFTVATGVSINSNTNDTVKRAILASYITWLSNDG